MDLPRPATGKRSRSSTPIARLSDSSFKRNRVDDGHGRMLHVSEHYSARSGTTYKRDSPDGTPVIVRDDEYYFSDGSCILRVENTLFNVSTCYTI